MIRHIVRPTIFSFASNSLYWAVRHLPKSAVIPNTHKLIAVLGFLKKRTIYVTKILHFSNKNFINLIEKLIADMTL